MKKQFRTLAISSMFAAAALASAAAQAAGGNLGAAGSLNTSFGVSGYSGTLNQSATSLSAGSTSAASNGTGIGSAGSETQLTTTGSAVTTGQFTNNGIVATSSFKSDSLSQTFGLAPTGDGFATSSGVGGTQGSALSTGNLVSGVAGLDTSAGFQLGLGLQATGSGFGH